MSHQTTQAESVPARVSLPTLAESRQDNFNALRLALAIGVLLSHSYPMVGAPEPILMGHSLGNFCVHVFFAVSGYMIAQSFNRSKSLGRYTLHRVLRIVPALLFAMLFARALSSYFGNFAANPIPGIINGSVWTIPWEILCYVLVGTAGLLGILTPTRYNAFFAAALVYSFANPQWTNESYLVLTPLLLTFAGGSFLALSENDISINNAALFAAVAAVLVQTEPSLHLVEKSVNGMPWPYGPGTGFRTVYSLLYLFAVPVLALWLGRYAPPLLACRNDLSYGTYLYAWPVQQGFVAMFAKAGWTLHPLLLFSLALVVTLSLAWISWTLLERPVLRLKNVDHQYIRSALARTLRP